MKKVIRVSVLAVAVVGIWSGIRPALAIDGPPPREPVRVEQTGRTNTDYSGPPNWGHITDYDLKVVDNQTPQGLYGLGTPYEAFGSVTYSDKPAIKSALIASGAPGTPVGPSDPWPEGATFTDENAWHLTFDTGVDTFWYSFPQTWHDVRVSDNKDFKLNTHTVKHFQGYAIRNY